MTVPPPPELAPDPFAARLYAALEPVADQDPAWAWSLLIYVNAIGTMFQIVDTIVSDDDDGPGWSALLDLSRCPDEALPWLGQFVGVRVPVGATPDQMRTAIAGHSGWERGTPAAMRSAIGATLTGTKTVVFRERDGGNAYHLGVVTYTDETPDQAATNRALMASKPAGLSVTYNMLAGQDWQLVKDGYATWTAVKTRYATWSDVKTGR